jgi:hypothetical protein
MLFRLFGILFGLCHGSFSYFSNIDKITNAIWNAIIGFYVGLLFDTLMYIIFNTNIPLLFSYMSIICFGIIYFLFEMNTYTLNCMLFWIIFGTIMSLSLLGCFIDIYIYLTINGLII